MDNSTQAEHRPYRKPPYGNSEYPHINSEDIEYTVSTRYMDAYLESKEEIWKT